MAHSINQRRLALAIAYSSCAFTLLVYSCIMRSIDKVTQKVMLVQKEKGGIVGKWLREQGRHEAVYEHN